MLFESRSFFTLVGLLELGSTSSSALARGSLRAWGFGLLTMSWLILDYGEGSSPIRSARMPAVRQAWCGAACLARHSARFTNGIGRLT